MEMAILKNLSTRSKNTAPPEHILFISYYFPPMGGGGVQRITKFLKYWNLDSSRLSVLTVKPSYYYTYDESLCAEIPAEVAIHRSGSGDPFRIWYLFSKLRRFFSAAQKGGNGRESAGWMRRSALSIFIPDSRIFWLPFALIKLWIIHRSRPIDLVVATMPPYTAGLIGALAKKWLNIPLCLDYRDAWNCNPYLPGGNPVHRNTNKWLERKCLGLADGIVFVNPVLEQFYRDNYPSIANIPHQTIRNGWDPEDFAPHQTPDGKEKSGIFTVGVLGTVYSHGNRPLTLVRAFSEMVREDTSLAGRMKIVFLGKWAPEFRSTVESLRLNGAVEFETYLPHKEALREARRFDALALALECGRPGCDMVTPGRIYEYLRLKRPVLAVCPENGDLANLVRECRAGEIVADEDVSRTKSILRQWLQNRENIGRAYSFENIDSFNRRLQTKAFQKFLQSLLREV